MQSQPWMPSLDRALVHWANAQPDAQFIAEVETGKALTYRAALQAVRGVQGLLGREPRTIVASLPGGLAASVLWLAALGGGHRLVLSSPETTAAEMLVLARRYRPDAFALANPEVAVALGGGDRLVLTADDLEYAFANGRTAVDPPAREGSLSLTTSGTTGVPKGVTLTARQIAWTAEQVRSSHRLGPNDRGLSVLPFFHINAPVVSLSATLLAGASMAIAPRFSRSRFWGWVEREDATWASIVPAIVAVLLESEPPQRRPEHLRFIRTASAPLPARHLLDFEERFDLPLVETYGLSEAGSQVAANPVPPGLHKAGSVGLPTGVNMRICRPAEHAEDRFLRDVLPGEEGEICVVGPGVIRRYDDGASADSFAEGWFRTGDLGRMDCEGYVYITGRIRDVINRGGEKIAPREVEEILLEHPGVEQAAVVGEPDPIYGQRVVAYIVARQPEPADLPTSVRTFAGQRLSRIKVPTRVTVVQSLPRTPNGKIQRHLIAVGSMVQDRFAG